MQRCQRVVQKKAKGAKRAKKAKEQKEMAFRDFCLWQRSQFQDALRSGPAPNRGGQYCNTYGNLSAFGASCNPAGIAFLRTSSTGTTGTIQCPTTSGTCGSLVGATASGNCPGPGLTGGFTGWYASWGSVSLGPVLEELPVLPPFHDAAAKTEKREARTPRQAEEEQRRETAPHRVAGNRYNAQPYARIRRF
jgi:hypothetical protein